jgi:dihydrofolate reductase
MMITADGYHADPDDGLAWHHVDHDFNRFAMTQLRDAGTLVFGRVTYEAMAAYWPTPVAHEAHPDVADAMNATPKVVVSRTITDVTWPGTQVISTDVEKELAKLKEQPGRDIVIQGSSTLTASLLPTGLIDELRIMVNPIILGRGKPLFAGARTTDLTLLKTEQFTSGNVLLCYQPIAH